MSGWGRGGRQSADDLAYGDLPQRWDRSRFERFGGGGPPGPPPRGYEEDYRYYERDTPRQRDIAVADRIEERGPRSRFEETDRYYEQDRYGPAGYRRRTDRELFGDVDPRELANMAVTPYRGPPPGGERLDIDIDIERRRAPAPPRPGIIRRQSSLDTFDRRPAPRYDDYRMAPYQPAPLPPRDPYSDFSRQRYFEPTEDYREVEITRERSIHRSGGRPKSVKSHKAKSVTTKRSSSSSSSSSSSDTVSEVKSKHTHRSHRAPTTVHEDFHEDIHTPGGLSIHESFHESVHGGASSVTDSTTHISKKFKKGKTRMPKRLVRREAIMDLGYPFDEEEAFFVLRIALEKEQIDEVMKISESYKNGGRYISLTCAFRANDVSDRKQTFEYKEEITAPAVPENEREEIIRTEWINPPTVVGTRSEHRGRRDSSPSGTSVTTRHLSPARTARSRHTSRHTSHSRHHSQPPPEFFEERKTVIEERSPSYAPGPPPPPPMAPPPPAFYEERKTVIEERGSPSSHYRSPSSHGGALIVQEKEYRSDRDIQQEISRLEAERRALRLEREAEDRRNMAVRIRERSDEEYQLVEYREPNRELLEIVESRERSPPRNIVRVEKDRKGKMALVRSSH
jgi:hypothetical protein